MYRGIEAHERFASHTCPRDGWLSHSFQGSPLPNARWPHAFLRPRDLETNCPKLLSSTGGKENLFFYFLFFHPLSLHLQSIFKKNYFQILLYNDTFFSQNYVRKINEKLKKISFNEK